MSQSETKRFLTKSRFQLALSCPRKLFYTGKKEFANQKNSNEFLKALAEYPNPHLFQKCQLSRVLDERREEIRKALLRTRHPGHGDAGGGVEGDVYVNGNGTYCDSSL